MEDIKQYGARYELMITGDPIALKRHRSYRHGNHLRMVDPSADDKMNFLAKALNNRPSKPLVGPLDIHLSFYMPRPKSHYRTGKYAGILKDKAPYWHTGKPDCDNLIKFVLDALNGVFWRDDSQVCKVVAMKRYDELPRIEMIVKGML